MLAALLLTTLTGYGDLGAPADQPNILLVVADDLGNDMVGVYGEGVEADQPPTPHIDRLAQLGMWFTNAYAMPVCSPTRACIMTGRHGFRTGIGTLIPTDSHQLPFEEVTIVELLKAEAPQYTSALVGKWHLGVRYKFIDPLLQGFDVFSGTDQNIKNYFDYRKWTALPGFNHRIRETRYSTTVITDEALQLVQLLPEPWFVWVAYHAVHEPLHEPPAHLHTRPGPLDTDLKKWQAMLEALDTEIGRLLAGIDLANTVVVFVGDNGMVGGLTASSPPSASKGTLREAGVNVPLIVAGRPAVPDSYRGFSSDALVCAVDIFSTVADFAGVERRARLPTDPVIDGVSIRPLLDGTVESVRSYAYAEKLRPIGGPPYDEDNLRMIRDGRWKLIRNVLRGRSHLFDLSTAQPHSDGPDLCPCDEDSLAPEQWEAYLRLNRWMDALSPDQPIQ